MKQIRLTVLLAIVVLLTMHSATAAAGGGSYEVVSQTYSQGNIEIVYPQITDLADGVIKQQINELLKNKPVKCWDEDCREMVGLTMRTTYEIRWQSANLLTVQYRSYRYMKGAAHPVTIFDTINIDINTGREIRLQDIVVIDEEFIAMLKAGEFKAVSPRVKEIMKFSDKAMIRELNEQGVFYVTPVSLAVKVTVPHVAGDFVIFEVKFQDISSKIKDEHPVWREFL